jgi:hypothetical protein
VKKGDVFVPKSADEKYNTFSQTKQAHILHFSYLRIKG